MKHAIQQFFVKKIYADHNNSRAVKTTLGDLLAGLGPNDFALNIGAGYSNLGPQVRNLELEPGPGIDYVGSVEAVPLDDDSVDLVITQEVLEHVAGPFKAVSEIARVLKPGGKAYIQLPFMIGYHGCPDDYWRFTHSGIEELARAAGLTVIDRGVSVGAATGFYRILVEFLAILFSTPIRPAYRVFKAFFALLFYPVKLLDGLMSLSPEAHRISGGYFIVVRK